MTATSETATATRLADLIDVQPDDVRQALDAAAHDEPGLATVQNVARFAASVGSEQLAKALDVDPFELIAGGWLKVQSVRDAAVRSLKTPGVPTLLTLGQHDVIAPAYPQLSIYCDGAPLATLKFTLELDARFKAVGLTIVDGRLQAVTPGDASALVRLKYKAIKLREQSTPAWSLPGRIAFAGGLPIPN
jgi:hypothetical protein